LTTIYCARRGACDHRKVHESLVFLEAFLRHPRRIGSVVPSSRFLERRIIDLAAVDEARVVVELGPGTGGTTRAILEAMRSDATLLGLEIDPRLHALLGRIDDPRLIAHLGSAESLREVLGAYGLARPEVIISGIPFSTLGRMRARRVLRGIVASLAPGGRFVAYQVRSDVARLCEPLFGPAHEELEPLNFPPVRVFCWVTRS
jgi:phospholipid N-methyltransferase